jgi:Xaa-Pro aminopeptidase
MKQNFELALAAAAEHKELPFPEIEFADRLTRIREQMAHRKIDLLFAMAPESIYYLSGFQGEWYQAQSGAAFPPTSGIAVHVDHDRLIHFETPSEAMLTAIGAVSQDVRIFPLEARRDGLPFILSELRADGWLTGTVGLELSNYRPNPVIAQRYADGFREQDLQVTDATDIIRQARHIKSPLEMAALEEAARIADIGMAAAKDAIGPGVMELEVFGEMVAAMARAGGEFSGILPPVMSGFRSNCLHPLASRKKMQSGERVNVDLCGVFKRYHCNLCRGFWIGDPPDDIVEFHNKGVGAFKIIEQMLRPGLGVRDLLQAVDDYYADQGIRDEAYWSGGYELGIAFPPDWVGEFIYDLSMTGPEEQFLANTVVNHECNFFAPHASGISATIDTFFFYDDGARIVSSHPRELQVIRP